MKKQFLVIVSLLLVAAMVAACGGNSGGNKPSNGGNTPSNSGAAEGNNGDDSKPKQRAVLVLPEEIGVNPFFQLMDEGFKRGGEEFGLEVKTIESSDPAAFEQNLRAAVAENYDLIVTATFQAEDALNKVAQENPNKTFAIIDTVAVKQPNVRSVGFREYEAAYLMGAAAGLSTKTNTVGAVVAMDTPLLKKYTGGFEQGLKATNPDAKFLVNYVGGFTDPAQAKELALQQHSQGADFIAGMAAVGDEGVFEAAKEQGFYTAGQDTDRTVKDPEHIVLAQLKGTDAVAYETLKSFAEGNFSFDTVEYGLAEGGVGLTFVTHDTESPLSDFIGQETIDQLKEMAEKIKSGELVVENPSAQ